MRNNSGTLTFEYFIRDHLGNVRVSFDGTGGSAVVRQENSYYPFGMTIAGNYTPTQPNNNLFNGGTEWQDDFGSNLPDLYKTFYRNYDAEIGRFISVDPKAVLEESLSPYVFAGDNPVLFNDPDGDSKMGPCFACESQYNNISGDAPILTFNYSFNSGGGDDGGSDGTGVPYDFGFTVSNIGGFNTGSGISGFGGGGGNSGAGGGNGNSSSYPLPLTKAHLLEIAKAYYPYMNGDQLKGISKYPV